MAEGRILVGTDFSEASQRAIVVAHKYAQHLGKEMEVLHVARDFSENVFPINLGDFEKEGKKIGDIVEQEAAKLLEEQLSKLEIGQTNEIFLTVKLGQTNAIIQERIESSKPDYLFVGYHGYSAIGEALIGSTTHHLLRLAAADTFVVKQKSSTAKTMMVCVDLSESCQDLIRRSCELAKALKAKIVLAHAVEPDTGLYFDKEQDQIFADVQSAEDLVVKQKEKALEKLEAMAKECKSQGVDVAIRAEANHSKKLKEIVSEMAEESGADLLVTLAHQKGRLERFFLGSTTQSLVDHSKINLLVLKQSS